MGYILTSIKLNVIYHTDENTGVVSLHLLEKGGPIVEANSLEEGKIKFTEALQVSNAVNILMRFTNNERTLNSLRKAKELKTDLKDSLNFISSKELLAA